MERVELKIDGMYQVQDSRHHRKYILYFHGKYIKKSAADRQTYNWRFEANISPV